MFLKRSLQTIHSLITFTFHILLFTPYNLVSKVTFITKKAQNNYFFLD